MLKKFARGAPYVIFFLILLRACGVITLSSHEHDWQEATCAEPRICSSCKAEEGEPLGHDWQNATCSAPKTCARCGEIEGSRLEHTWVAATCTESEHCAVCGKENIYSSPLGHEWIPATLSSPMTCTRCGEQNGDPLSLGLFNRGYYGRWNPCPTADEYVGLHGYVAVTHISYLYPSSSTKPYENNWLSSPWFATTYEKDKQFFNAVGTVEHKTPVVVIEEELTISRRAYRYQGFLLVEQTDTGERFYISIVDFIADPYWNCLDVTEIPSSAPCLAVYHQRSDYYPVDRNGKKVTVAEGEAVLIRGSSFSCGGVDYTTNQIDATIASGRCFFNAADLDIVYY